VKASSLRWSSIAPWGALFLAMVGLACYRMLRASSGDTSEAVLLLGLLVGALCVAALIVVFAYRRAATTARGLLDVLDGRYPGQAFAVFKTVGLQDDIATLPVSLRGVAWDRWTLYAVLTLDSESMTFWDGSAKKPKITARLDRSEVRSIDAADDAAFVFNARALKVALLHDAVTLRLTFAPARSGDWIFLPATDSFAVLKSTLANSMCSPPES